MAEQHIENGVDGGGHSVVVPGGPAAVRPMDRAQEDAGGSQAGGDHPAELIYFYPTTAPDEPLITLAGQVVSFNMPQKKPVGFWSRLWRWFKVRLAQPFT